MTEDGLPIGDEAGTTGSLNRGMPATLGKDLRGTLLVRTSGILCIEQGQEIGWPCIPQGRVQVAATGPATL